MKKKRHNSAFKRFLTSRLFLVISLIVIGFVALSYARAYYQDYTIRQEIDLLQKEVQQLQRKRLESMEILSYVTEDAFVEEKARVDLNMKKPGEHVLFIEDPGTVVDTSLEREEPNRQFVANPVKWWYYFTHKSLESI
jgi:cell division protein FtsB